MRFKIEILSLVFLLFVVFANAQNSIGLAGAWKVKLDEKNKLIQKYPENCLLEGTIELPASLAEKGFGYKTKGSDYGILTPEYKYIGKAWYTREIQIPENWKNKEVEVFLERVLWESRIFIDDIECSKQDALGTPHIHTLGKLAPGKHKLTVRVDNEMIHNIGDKGHAYGEYTQSIWNGIVGKIELQAFDPLRIVSVNVFPDILEDELDVKIQFRNEKRNDFKLKYQILNSKTGEIVLSGTEKIQSNHPDDLNFTIPLNNKLKKWSEFTPEVYVLKTTVQSDTYSDYKETEFGFSQLSHNGTKIVVNGNPVFLRGNLDCVHFPLTGYASCEIEDWERIFKIYKSYGLNHARFHSWCPPEAAFKAANRVGIYLQAEASIWIDWWMSTDMIARGRPEMDTKGHPKGLGYDISRDSFVIAEMNRVVDYYGNNPSFALFCIGNELGNSDFDVMKNWIADLKRKDPRRLYAVSTARKIMDVDDYSATHYIQDVGRTRGLNGANTDWDFEEVYSKMNIPIIAHEIGQWPVYPKWSEIEKYTGVLKARNFQEFKLVAEKNGIADQDLDFSNASGALNQLMYKYETESFLRTASCAGVQLLSMQDYQGQGEALIGWLDAHWDSKGITTPAKFREHFNTTVPLLRMKKFVWTSDEYFTATAQVSHYGMNTLKTRSNWKIEEENGNIVSQGTFGENTFEIGTLTDLGTIRFQMNEIETAKKLTVEIELEETEFRNSWDFWVFPAQVEKIEIQDVLIANKLNEQVKKVFENGGKVLLIANELGTEETSVETNFYPLYWSLTFFPGQGKTNIGLLLKDKHPAFSGFPTSSHSDWQWETISSGAKGFILNDLPADYKPIAQPIDDFHRNNKVGSIFELKVGKGSLLVCGYNLNADLPVARQLKSSLMKYMNSGDFNPQQKVEFLRLKNLLPEIRKAETAALPEEFKNAILFVKAASKLGIKESNLPWKKDYDNVKIASEANYQVKADGVWKDNSGSAWHGKEMQIEIDCPEGILGTLYVHFHDWNNNDRTGLLEFEGRKMKLEKHDKEGKWVKFHVMREDSNDGKLILKTTAQTGPNLMITEVLLVKE